MDFKSYCGFNFLLHFYCLSSIRSAILLSNNNPAALKDNYFCPLFNELFFSNSFSFDPFYSIFEKYLYQGQTFDAINLLNRITAKLIYSFPSIVQFINKDKSFGSFTNNNSTQISILEYRKDWNKTINDISKSNYELRSVLVIINPNIPLVASYVRLENNNWFRFHTKFQKVNETELNEVMSDKSKQIILFLEKKTLSIEPKFKKISPLLDYPNIDAIFTQKYINEYPYQFFELSLKNRSLMKIFKQKNLTFDCQIEVIRLLKQKLINDENYKQSFEKYKAFIQKNNQEYWSKVNKELMKK